MATFWAQKLHLDHACMQALLPHKHGSRQNYFNATKLGIQVYKRFHVRVETAGSCFFAPCSALRTNGFESCSGILKRHRQLYRYTRTADMSTASYIFAPAPASSHECQAAPGGYPFRVTSPTSPPPSQQLPGALGFPGSCAVSM